jgi:hypothetical protein
LIGAPIHACDPQPQGDAMNFDLIIKGGFLALFSLFTAVFLLQRFQYRRKKAANPNYRGFYPTATALSLTLLSLQTIAQPDLNHALEQRQTEAADEDENGDPNDPAAQLNRQLKRIRNGEDIDTLKVPLRMRS